MAKSADDKLGYEFEDELKKHFKNIQAKHPIFWHQFPDSKTAGKLIAAQPSDFIVTASGQPAWLLEAKASCEIPTFAKCAKSHTRSSQVGMHKKWHRAGKPSLFIFYCEIDGIVEVWDGAYVTDRISDNVKMLDDRGLLAKDDYFNLEAILLRMFGLLGEK